MAQASHPLSRWPDSGPAFIVEVADRPVVIDGMQIGTIQPLGAGYQAVRPSADVPLTQVRAVGLVVLDGEAEPFGGPRVADALVRATEFLKAKGWRPAGSEAAPNA